jgi:putative ABC transport system permease protein
VSRTRPLLAPLLLRPFREDRGRFVLTVAGIAVGVATMAAILLANASVLSSFTATVDVVAGKAGLTVLADGPGIPEETLERLAWLRTKGIAIVPAVSATIALGGGAGGDGEVLELLGIDPVTDPSVRDYRFVAETADETSLKRLFGIFRAGAVLLPAPLAKRLGLAPGAELDVLSGGAAHRLRVAGILELSGAARAAAGSVLFTDLATAQEVLGREGHLDRIDLVLPAGLGEADRTALEASVRDSLPPGVTVGRPERRTATVDRMVRSFRVNLTALGLVALLVGTYFVYNTLSISVLRRRSDIGTVRALGASARSVFLVFLAEGAALGVLGGALGVALGALLARIALAAVGGTATDFYLPQAAPVFTLDPAALATSFLAGLVASILSALAPAVEAARVQPAATFRRGSVEASRRRAVGPLALGGVVALGLAALATRPGPVNGLPLFGFASVFLVIAGVSLLAPLAVVTVARLADGPAVRLLGVEARIARANLTGSLSRTAVAVAALSMGISMMVAVAFMVGSFRATVVDWVSQTLKADLFVAPESGRSQRALGRLPEEAIRLVASVPGVASVDPFLSFEATRDGAPYTIGSGRFDLVAAHGDLPMADGSRTREVLARALEGNEAVVSEPYSVKFGVKAGDTVTLPAVAGPIALRVAGVYRDYSNDRGTVTIDRALFRRIFRMDGAVSLAVRLDPGVAPEEARRRLFAAADGRYALRVQTNAALREAALALFDRTFAVTWALEAVAIAVAVLGVFSTLLALVLERRREIALLRVLGASAARVARAVRLEAAALSSLGIVLGVAAGAAMGLVLVHVVNRQSFGWTIRTEVPWLFLAGALALVLLATLVAAARPARLAAATDPAAVLKEE